MGGEFIKPDWPAPATVRAHVTTRNGGRSRGAYASFNLAEHVGDAPGDVAFNRRVVRERLGLPEEPHWLSQQHGRVCARLDEESPVREADAAVCSMRGRVCAVLTADCLPVLFCDRDGTRVGIAHAGWRGLCAGVLESTVEGMGCGPAELLAWLGPAIGPRAFRVGDDVRDAFGSDADATAFLPDCTGKWTADLYRLARGRLERLGVGWIGGGAFCTYHDRRFYSYRRDKTTGRMASLIWLATP